MNHPLRRKRPFLTWLLAPAFAAGCVAGLPTGHGPQDPASAQRAVEREVVLRVDPRSGTARLEGDRAVLATIESELNLSFDAVGVSQTGGNTAFTLQLTNAGSDVSDLSLRLASARSLVSPSNPIAVGALASGASEGVAVSFANPEATAFSVTIYVNATLKATGSQGSNGGGGTTPTPTPSVTPTPAPSATPTPVPSGATDVPNPGPNAARGRVLLNGKGAINISSVSTSYGRIEFSLKRVVNGSWVQSIPLTSDSQGYFTAGNLVEGDYFVYYYNEIQRDKIGFWQSKVFHVSPTAGAAFPAVDLYMVGQENVPLPGATARLPVAFSFNAPKQTPLSYRFRLHSAPGTSFKLVYQSNKFPGDQTTFTWDGTGAYEPLDTTAHYFWGVSWDWGPLGAGGNLYQKIRFSQ